MKYAIIPLLFLVGCKSPTAAIRENARQISQELGGALEAQDTILDSLDRLRGHTGALEVVAEEIPSPQKEEVLSHATAIEEDALAIEDAVDDTKEVLEDGTNLSAAILKSSDRVQDKPGWWVQLWETIGGWAWWVIPVALFVLIGTLGLWPVIVNAFINFTSAIGWGISRSQTMQAESLYRLQQEDHTPAAQEAIDQLRASALGEAAWRRAKRHNQTKV